MIKSKTVGFAGKNVTVNELTVAQVTTFLEDAEADVPITKKEDKRIKPHALDSLMDSPLPFHLLLQCVPELSQAEIEASGATAIEPLYDAAEEVNPFFFKMAEKLTGGPRKRPADPHPLL